MSVFQSAIVGSDGTVDPGYLAMYCSLVGCAVSSFVLLCMGAYALSRATNVELAAIIQSTGIALGAAAATFATIVGAVGLFRAGDKQHAAPTSALR